MSAPICDQHCEETTLHIQRKGRLLLTSVAGLTVTHRRSLENNHNGSQKRSLSQNTHLAAQMAKKEEYRKEASSMCYEDERR